MAQPARHREQAGKTYPPAIQSSASAQRSQPAFVIKPEKSTLRRSKVRPQRTTEMRRLKQLEDENSKLRKVVADLSLDKEMLQDVIRRKL